MAETAEQLVVLLEARISDFERNMKKANRAANENFEGIENRARRAAKGLEDAFSKSGQQRIKVPMLDTSGIDRGAKLTFQQLEMLKGAVRDTFGSLSAGQSPLTVLMQQSGQVVGALGEDGVMGLLGGIGDGLKGLVTPATAAMAGIAAVGLAGAYAFSRFTEQRLATELALTGIGQISGITADQIDGMAEKIAKASGVTVASGRDIAVALAAMGHIGADNLADVGALAKGYGKLFGKDMADAGKELAAIFGGDIVAGADKLDGRLGMLDDKTRAYVRTLVQQGERQKAIGVLVAAVRPELLKAAEATSVWAKAWNAVKDGADSALISVGGAIDRAVSGPSPAERLSQLRARRDGTEADYVAELRKSGLDDKAIKALVPTYQSDTRDLDEQIKATEELIAAEEKRRKALAEDKRTNEASKMAGELVRSFNDEAEAISNLENRYKALGKVLADPGAVAKLEDAEKAKATYAELEKRIESLKADYQAGGQAAAQALKAADFANATAGLDSYRKGLAEINRQYDEQIRLARQAGDAATTNASVATLEAAKSSAISAYKTEADQRARASVSVPSDYAAGVVAAESGGDASARNSRSSATGLGQFIASTWLNLFKRVFADEAAGMSDEAILALRTNREKSIALINEYARENGVALARAGFDATSANLNLAHFLGAGGAIKMLKADPSTNAASILPDAAASNPEVFKRGSASVADILAYAERRAQKGSASGKAQQDAVTAERATAEAYDKSTEAAIRLKSVQEQLDVDREKGGELGKSFATAQELIKASSDKLTPALKAQRDEVLALADARAKAAQTGLTARFDADMSKAREDLGRTSSENAARTTAKSYGFDLASDAGKNAVAVAELNSTLAETKNLASSAMSSFASDLLRGTSAADALRNQLLRIADVLINKLSEKFISSLFGSVLGSSSGASLFGGAGSILGFDGGGYTGDGGRLEPAGIVHKGEYVLPQDVVKRLGVRNLEALRRGYANGGLVGGTAPSLPRPSVGGVAAAGSRVVTIAPAITINSTGGTPDQNRELAEQHALAIQDTMRGLVRRELAQQLRPNGMFNR